MKLVTIANQKGGSGKSTLTVLLATALAATYGYRVGVLDLDPQQSLYQIRAVTDEGLRAPDEEYAYPILPMSIEEAWSHLEQHSDEYDIVFLDLPGRSDSGDLLEMIANCNVVIVPMRASMFDRLSTASFLDGILAAQKSMDEPFAVYGLRTMFQANTREENDLTEYLRTSPLPMFTNFLPQRESFKRASTLYSFLNSAFRRGIAAHNTAGKEIHALCEELIEKVDLPREVEETAAEA